MSKNLTFKTINDLLGKSFHILSYQRGYRWTKHQVTDLLNDIWTFANRQDKKKAFYCLQPIVVKRLAEKEDMSSWEVVDGQQRLTTIYIILSYITKEYLKVESLMDEYGSEIFSIKYDTRPGSEAFIKNIRNDKSNIDYYHMWLAYNTVKEWFTNGGIIKDRNDREKFLTTILGKVDDDSSVQVIWYEVEENANSRELFSRLNLGKIPLTNSELIKALFLSESSFDTESKEERVKKKTLISYLWDEMEQKLSDPDLWSFISNENQAKYSTKIELLFNMISNKDLEEIDHLYTFIYFLNETKNDTVLLWDIWLKIEQYYLTIIEWYRDRNLYHKIGYLVTIGTNLKHLIEKSLDSKKTDFKDYLGALIKESIESNISSLSYEKSGDRKKIERILLLFNAESIRNNEGIREYYPFKFHKSTDWSLEHIHAQNSEDLDKTKKEPWLRWIKYHKDLLNEIIPFILDEKTKRTMEEVLEEMNSLNNENITWDRFETISKRVTLLFTEDGKGDDIHEISNLALLGQAENSALNNSVFEVKRRAIIEMDREGKYIPICTRRVFLKYYNSKPSAEHYYYWGREDQINYFNEIVRVLKEGNYLSDEFDEEV